jgi:hypothetical protein
MNFVDGADAAEDQTGEGPWLQVIRDLFPLRINRAVVENGSVHFRTFVSDPPVDVYLNDVNGRIENLTNIRGEMAPLITTVHVRAKAMDQANVLMEMKLDPFSYQPTFKLALQLIGLDVTRTNDLVRTYSGVDFTHGWFDLVVELDAVEGLVTGYVKPLYRDLQVLDLDKDLRTNNPLTFIWEGLVEGATELLKNQPRDQFGTLIPLSGRLDAPRADILATVGNILRNAFIRAYLPRLERADESYAGVAFEPAQPLANIPIQSPGTHDPDPMLLTPSAPAADPLKEASP